MSLIMDLEEGGNLFKYVQDYGAVPEAVAIPWIGQILAGLNALHSRSTAHRDVKPENVFISGDKRTVKLGDAGTAKVIDGPQAPNVTGVSASVVHSYLFSTDLDSHLADNEMPCIRSCLSTEVGITCGHVGSWVPHLLSLDKKVDIRTFVDLHQHSSL